MRNTTLLILSLLCLLTTGLQADIIFSDDFSADTTANYINPTGRDAFDHSAGGGVGGDSGYLSPSTTSNNVANYNTSLGDFTESPFYTVSAFGRRQSNGSNVSFNVFGVGLGNDTSNLLGSGYTGFETLIRGANTGSDTFFLRLRQNDSGTDQEVSSNFTLLDENWYELEMTVTLTDSGTGAFDISSDLYNRGTDGTAARSLLGSVSGSYTSTVFAGSANVFSGVLALGGTNGFDSVDNFSVTAIPEPSSLVLIGLALASVAFLKRGRRN